MARVLIAGCGYVGRSLGARLTARGDSVWGLKRIPLGLPPGVTPLPADLLSRPSLCSVPSELDAVVYSVSAADSSEAAYEDAYLRGLENLLDELEGRIGGKPRLLFLSSTAVYGDRQGGVVDETTPARPDHFSGRILLAAEQLAASAGSAIAVRLGGIYGPGRDRWLREVREGKAVRPSAPTFTNRIHRDDAAGAIAHLLALEEPEAVYNGGDREPAELGEVLTWLADQLCVPAPPFASESGARLGRGSKRCSSARLVASGYSFRYPTFREGYGALIAGDD